MSRVILTLTFGLLLLAGLTGAASAALLRGKVTSTDGGEALPYANVVVIGTGFGAVTELDGTFALELPPGRYQVMATYVSFESQTRQATVGQSGATVDFALKPAATRLGAIEVLGERSLVDVKKASTVRSVDSKQIMSMPVDAVDAVVGRQVGVSLYDDEIFIRGGRFDEAVFIVDGVVVRDYVSGQSRAGNLSSNSIAEINVLTGGYSAEYGQALSGVIDIKTREGSDYHRGYVGWTTDHPVSGWTGFRTDNTTFQIEGPVFREDSPLLLGGLKFPGKLNYFIDVEGRISDTYLPGWSNQGPARRSSYEDIFLGSLFTYGTNMATRADNEWQLLAKLNWKKSARDHFGFSLNKTLNISSGFFHRPIIRVDPTFGTTYPWEWHQRLEHYLTVTEDNAIVSGVWTHHFGRDRFHELRVSRFFANEHLNVNGMPWFEYEEPNDLQLFEGDPHPYYIDSGDFPLWHDHSVEERTFDYDLTAVGEKQTWKVGLEHSWQTVQFIEIERPWQEDPDGLGGRHDLYNVRPQVGAAYIQGQLEYEGLVANLGMRLDYWYPGPEVEDAVTDTSRVVSNLGVQQAFEEDTVDILGNRVKMRWSPRISVSHPITERNHMFFNYGRFTQWPNYFYVYSKIGSISSEDFPLIGNLNLDPEVSTQFEFGGAHLFREDLALDVTLFFKDQYDYPTSVRRSVLGQGDIFIYDNLHHGRSRGIELELQKRPAPYLGVSVGYTFSISTGLSSDPNESQEQQELQGSAAQIGLEDGNTWWNRPHEVTLALDFRVPRGDERPTVPFIGVQVPDALTVHLFYSGRSGSAYTPEDIRGAQTGKRYSKNAAFEHTVDVKFQRRWESNDMGLTGTFEVRNLFNYRSPRRIDPSTGEKPRAGTGQYTFPPSSASAREFEEAQLSNPSWLRTPRQVRLGFGFSW